MIYEGLGGVFRFGTCNKGKCQLIEITSQSRMTTYHLPEEVSSLKTADLK